MASVSLSRLLRPFLWLLWLVLLALVLPLLIRGQPADRDAPNIFIVDKGREHDVILRLRMALWDFCVISAVCLASSLWLAQAAWPWLA